MDKSKPPVDRYGFFDTTNLPRTYPEIFKRVLQRRKSRGHNG